MDAKVYAASVDDVDHASEIAGNLSYPVAYGITREDTDKIGAWWEDRRSIVQPSEFILGADGKSRGVDLQFGPVGRILATDAVKIITLLRVA